MYLTPTNQGFDPNELRQGDILVGIPFPLIDNTKIEILGTADATQESSSLPAISPATHEHRGDREWVKLQVPGRYGYCAVLSNCCDLQRRSGRIQIHAVALGRVRPISEDIRRSAERYESLRANKDPRDAHDPGYIDYFYLARHERLENSDWVVHYNQLFSVPSVNAEFLSSKKILQLTNRERMKFKIKLAFTFGRANDEEIAAGLEDPWHPPHPGAPAQ